MSFRDGRLRDRVFSCRLGGLCPDAQHDQEQGHSQLRLEHRACRVRDSRQAGQLDRLRRGLLPRRRGGDLQRSRQGEIRSDHRPESTHRAAIRRCRRPGAQHHLEPVARHLARPQLHRRHVLRRPGLHRAQVAEGDVGARAIRRSRLRRAGHHDRAQSFRLFPCQQDEDQDRHVRHRGRHRQSL